MNDNTQTKIEGRCPVCGVRLVRVIEGGEMKALAHGRPICTEYAAMTAKDFTSKYFN